MLPVPSAQPRHHHHTGLPGSYWLARTSHILSGYIALVERLSVGSRSSLHCKTYLLVLHVEDPQFLVDLGDSVDAQELIPVLLGEACQASQLGECVGKVGAVWVDD